MHEVTQSGDRVCIITCINFEMIVKPEQSNALNKPGAVTHVIYEFWLKGIAQMFTKLEIS